RAARQIIIQEKQRADEQAATASAIEEFLETDLFARAASEPPLEEKPEPDLKVRSVLDRASQKIDRQFLSRPLVEARLRMTLAVAYHDLGEYSIMERHVRLATDLYRRTLGETNAESLKAAAALGDATRHLDRKAEAIRLLQKTLEEERRVLGPHDTN